MRPKPQITSSEIIGISCLRRIGRDRLEIALGRRDDAARAHHRLGEEAGNGVGALAGNGVLKLAREALDELLLGRGLFRRSAGNAGRSGG